MNEKILGVSTEIDKSKYKKRCIISLIVAIVLFLIAYSGRYRTPTVEYPSKDAYIEVYGIFGYQEYYDAAVEEYWAESDAIATFVGSFVMLAAIPFVFIFIPNLILIIIYSGKSEITVTDKRVYGKARSKQVNLPLDSISAVSIYRFKGISVSTASGAICFIGIANRDELYNTISSLLIERQSPKNAPAVASQPQPVVSTADELKKYKELLDSGIITQEEFDAKKKQLLGL